MKKLLSITLCALIILSSISVATFTAASEMSLKQAIEIYEKNSGEKVNTKRYYFLMPNGTNSEVCDDEFYKNYGERPQSWYNENATTAGVWWWGTGKIDPQWPGFKMMKDTSESVYYADVPDFVETLIFNNYFHPGNVSWNDPTYFDSAQTISIDLSGIEAGESYMYPEGLDGFENMIYVLEYDCDVELEPKNIWGGEWYYYYGNGCYGTKENGNEHDCIRDDHDHENLYINFDPSNTGWTDYENIYCIIRGTTYSPYYPAGSVPTLCTDYDGDGIYTYDLNKSKFNFKDQYLYYVSFENDKNERTETLPLQTINIKDTVYATGEIDDHYKTSFIKWTNDLDVVIPSLKEVVKEQEKKNNVEIETYRNYFLIPDGSENYVDQYGLAFPNWFNEYSTEICINYYSYNCEDFPVSSPHYVGFSIEQLDNQYKNLYYADIPVNIKEYNIDNGTVMASHIPTYAICESYNITHSSSNNYHDDMIYVFDEMDRVSATMTAMCGGTWYYYLGADCYAKEKNGECVNPQHDHKSVKEAVADYEAETGEKVETNRYYFLMPNGKNGELGDDNSVDENGNHYGNYNKFAPSWYNEYTNTPAIYWWYQNVADPQLYPGYTVEKGDADCVYYADVPKAVDTIIWNNNVRYSFNKNDDPRFWSHQQTINIPCEYYDAGESPNYPQGTDSFDNMIFVCDPDIISTGDINIGNAPLGGEWYYYYSDGCYGFEKDGDENDCLRDDHFHKDIHEDFVEYLGITMEDEHFFNGELYYHYENGSQKPTWILTYGCPRNTSGVLSYGVFGDYVMYGVMGSPSDFVYHIYVVDEEKFYSIEDAWTNDIICCKEEIFTKYLRKEFYSARLIGDATEDNALSILDATYIQQAVAKYRGLDDLILEQHAYGDELKYITDFDRDGERTIFDATKIQMKLAKIE